MADESKIPLTVEVYNQLDVELQELLSVKRPEISRRIQEAREEGDLKENGGYHAAREEQGIVEARISKLEKIMKSAYLTNSSEYNFKADLHKCRLEAQRHSREALFFAAVLDYLNAPEELESSTEQIESEEISSELVEGEKTNGSLDTSNLNRTHLSLIIASTKLQRIIDAESLEEGHQTFFKAQIDRAIFAIREALGDDAKLFIVKFIPELRKLLVSSFQGKDSAKQHELNECIFRILKVVYKELANLSPNDNDATIEASKERLTSPTVEESILRGIGEDNMNLDFNSIWYKIQQLLKVRANRLKEGRTSTDSNMADIDAELHILQRLLAQMSYNFERASIARDDGESSPTEVANMKVVTAEFNGRETEFLLGPAEMADSTDLTVYSPDSPLGNAILGAEIGDTVEYTAPTGKKITVKIVAVKHFEG